MVDYVVGELDKENKKLNDNVKEKSLKILNVLLQYGANPDLVPEGRYSFNATEYAEYNSINYLAAELYRNGSDVQTKSQTVGVGSISNKILGATGLVLLAKEEFTVPTVASVTRRSEGFTSQPGVCPTKVISDVGVGWTKLIRQGSHFLDSAL